MSAFSLLVIGDTQYLFDGGRQRPELLAETFRHVHRLVEAGAVAPVRHVVHVGDVTEHGWADEAAAATPVLRAGRELLGGVAVTVATGNHDVAHHSDDTRGPTPFGAAFGPGCALLDGRHAGAVLHGPGGYSSWRVLTLPDGGELGVLALDWRPSVEGWRWADDLLTAHAHLPTVVVSHESAHDGALTPHGARLSEALEPHPQVFLVLSGHEWPSTRVTVAGREFHTVNYQELPFGGAGAARLYEVDPARGQCQVISLCPALHRPELIGSVEARRRLALGRAEDQFAFTLPRTLGGLERPWQAAGLTLRADLHGQEAPFEFELDLPDEFVLEAQLTLPPAMPRGWQVALARLGSTPGSPEPLAALSLSSENFLGWMAFTRAGETWATSHEYQPGASVTVVLANGRRPGVWVDGDPVGRTEANLAAELLPGPWRWRLGAGEYEGRETDRFGGTVTHLRAWA